MSVLIKNGRVWNGELFSQKDILIEGAIIKEVADHISCDDAFQYDATGKIVTPGLVDIHMHMRGISPDRFGMQAEMACFPFGVTAANDAWGEQGDKKLLDTFMIKNTVFVIVDIVNNHACFENADRMLEKYGTKAIGIKVCFDKSNAQVEDITPLKEACDYATEKNLKVMVHCSDSPVAMQEIIKVLRSGDILTHAFHGRGNHAMQDDFECLLIARERGIYIDVGMAADVHTNFDIFSAAIKNHIVPDIISTDLTKNSCYKRGGRYGIAMCMSVAKHLGMTEEDIFCAVTTAPAKALNKAAEWGWLKEGRTADIAVFDYTNEVFDLTDNTGTNIKSEKGYKCVLTISDGEVVYRG